MEGVSEAMPKLHITIKANFYHAHGDPYHIIQFCLINMPLLYSVFDYYVPVVTCLSHH